jgi:hypothetical protein
MNGRVHIYRYPNNNESKLAILQNLQIIPFFLTPPTVVQGIKPWALYIPAHIIPYSREHMNLDRLLKKKFFLIVR